MSDLVEEMCPEKEMVMKGAWASCLSWTASQPDAIACFRADTGCTYQPPTSAIDQMIDQATGHEADFVRQFITWFNENVWGKTDEQKQN